MPFARARHSQRANGDRDTVEISSWTRVFSYRVHTHKYVRYRSRDDNTYHVITHGDEQVKKQGTAILHFSLHGAAALEGPAAADDKRQVVRPQLRVVVRRVGIGVTGGCKDRAALDAVLEALLAQGESFELVETVLFGRAAADKSLALLERVNN